MEIKELHPEQKKYVWDLTVSYYKESPDLLLDKLCIFCEQTGKEHKSFSRNIADVISFINKELEYCICVEYKGIGSGFYNFKNNDIISIDNPLSSFITKENSTYLEICSKAYIVAESLLQQFIPNLTKYSEIYSHMNTLVSGIYNFSSNGFYNSKLLNITLGEKHPFYTHNINYLTSLQQAQQENTRKENILNNSYVLASEIRTFYSEEAPEKLLEKKTNLVNLNLMQEMPDDDFLFICTGNTKYIKGKDTIHLLIWEGQTNEFHNFIDTLFEDFNPQRWDLAKTSCRIKGEPIPENIRQNKKIGQRRLSVLNKALSIE